MASTKPSIPEVPADGPRKFFEAIKITLEIITGRRNNKATKAANATAKAAAASPPTKAEYDALLRDVNEIRTRLNAFIDRQDS